MRHLFQIDTVSKAIDNEETGWILHRILATVSVLEIQLILDISSY